MIGLILTLIIIFGISMALNAQRTAKAYCRVDRRNQRQRLGRDKHR